jgi:hypothetical protein
LFAKQRDVTVTQVRILYLPPFMEDCPRGLWSLLGKQVGVKTTQVRILYLPPHSSLSIEAIYGIDIAEKMERYHQGRPIMEGWQRG